MSKRNISANVDNVCFYNTDDVNVITYDYNIDGQKGHRVMVKTTKKFKQSMQAKIEAYCKSRQKRY